MHRLLLVLSLGLIVAACSSAGDAPTTMTDDAAIASDFSLRLGDGSTFTLSEETRPVFMVFWAEW